MILVYLYFYMSLYCVTSDENSSVGHDSVIDAAIALELALLQVQSVRLD